MESFVRGWNFLKQAWQMAMKDRDLIKPSIYALFAGFIVSLIGAVPMILAAILFGDRGTIGQIIIAALGAVLVFINYLVSYIFAAMTVYLIFGFISEGDGRMDKAWAIVKRDLFDIMTLAAASTLVNLVKNAVRGKGNQGGRNFLAGLIETVWSEYAFLVLPIMVIEDVNLKDGLKRATNIAKNNLLLIGVSTVGVRGVTGLIGFVVGMIGLVLGLGIGYGLIALLGTGVLGLVVGIGLGALVFFAFTMVATVLNTYTGTAYHTCLYLWAREAEQARAAGSTAQVAAPAPLAAVLG
jgi:hypothetical protein